MYQCSGMKSTGNLVLCSFWGIKNKHDQSARHRNCIFSDENIRSYDITFSIRHTAFDYILYQRFTEIDWKIRNKNYLSLLTSLSFMLMCIYSETGNRWLLNDFFLNNSNACILYTMIHVCNEVNKFIVILNNRIPYSPYQAILKFIIFLLIKICKGKCCRQCVEVFVSFDVVDNLF